MGTAGYCKSDGCFVKGGDWNRWNSLRKAENRGETFAVEAVRRSWSTDLL